MLDCYASASDDILALLNKFKLGAKIDLSIDDEIVVYVSQNNGYDDPRHVEFGKRLYLKDKYESGLTETHHINYELSLPRLYIDFESGKYFPFDVGYNNFNAISYTKGCYIGQEVITRTHFRGVSRKKIYQVEVSGDLPDISSQPLNIELFSGEQKVGTLLGTYGRSDCYIRGLALLKDEVDSKLLTSANIRCSVISL